MEAAPAASGWVGVIFTVTVQLPGVAPGIAPERAGMVATADRVTELAPATAVTVPLEQVVDALVGEATTNFASAFPPTFVGKLSINGMASLALVGIKLDSVIVSVTGPPVVALAAENDLSTITRPQSCPANFASSSKSLARL